MRPLCRQGNLNDLRVTSLYLFKIDTTKINLNKKSKSAQNKGKQIFLRNMNVLICLYLEVKFMIVDKISLILTIIGALNWGSIGLFQFDIVAWICGGPATLVARIIYTLVALAGIWCISLLFRESDEEIVSHA
jgi:uncharacterized membrane protein YuzA (DUF378 family)